MGSALAALPAGEAFKDREVLLWTLVHMHTRGGDRPKKVPRGGVERIYQQESGMFAPLLNMAALASSSTI